MGTKMMESKDEVVDDVPVKEENNLDQSEQLTFEAQILQIKKTYINVVEEKSSLHQDLVKTKKNVIAVNDRLIQAGIQHRVAVSYCEDVNKVNLQLQLENEWFKEKMSEAVTENQRLKEQHGSLMDREEQLTIGNQKLVEEKDNLQDKVDLQDFEIQEAKLLLANTHSKLMDIKAEIRDTETTRSKIQAEFEELQECMSEFNASLHQIHQIGTDVLNDLDNTHRQNILLSKQITSLQQELSEKDLKIQRRQNVAPSIPSLKTLEKELDVARHRNVSLSNQVVVLRTVLREQEDYIAGYKFVTPTPGRPGWLKFLLIVFALFLAVVFHICYHGAIIPSWVYIQIQHDGPPPQ